MKALALLIKPASGNCNLRCSYCFYSDVANSRKLKDRGMMSLETLELLIKKTLAETTEWVSFGFQGGEPTLMGLDYFKEAMMLQEKYNIHRATIANTIQTNGLLIDKSWADFFAKNNFLVGLSLDGGRETHDSYRRDAKGRGTYDRCLNAAKVLAHAGAEFNVLTVLTNTLASDPEGTYTFYKEQGLRFIQFIPCIDDIDKAHGENSYSLDSKRYGDFLCKVFDLWFQDLISDNYHSIRLFDNYVRMLMGENPDNCGMVGQCQPYPTIEADGTVYPCDFYVVDHHKLGDIFEDKTFEELLMSQASVNFAMSSQVPHEKCARCQYFELCRGGCRRDREPFHETSFSLNYYCEAYEQFFAHALPRLQEVASKMPRR